MTETKPSGSAKPAFVRGGLAERVIALALAVAAALLAILSGASASLEDSFGTLRDEALSRPASGNVVIVEIDAHSLSKLGNWPWPRERHAAILDRLNEARAGLIVFDVDFSSRSTPESDAALEQALARASGKVVLPTFRQAASAVARDEVENLPLPRFRPYVMLASVNVQPERDGRLVYYSYGTITGGLPRPSLASLIAGTQGQIGDRFRIDTTIEPDTIPRISAIDLIEGRFEQRSIAGRSVVIGATAIEMGDRYALPRYGIQPGVVAQALAAETLIAGTQMKGLGPLPALLATILLIAVIQSRRSARAFTVGRAMVLIALLALPFVAKLVAGRAFDVVPAVLFVLVEAALLKLGMFLLKVRAERATDAVTGLPNAAALIRSTLPDTQVVMVVARVLRFEAIEATVVEDDLTLIAAKLVERLDLGFPEVAFHAVAPGTIAWIDGAGETGSLVARIEAAAALFRAPVAVAGRTVPIVPTFGICAGPGSNVHTILAQAILAARQGEVSGRRWSIHSEVATSETQRELRLLADIDSAIESGDIFVAYQPKLRMTDRRVTSAEALVRWNHPELGAIAPDNFISLLEGSGDIAQLTLAVLDQTATQLRRWTVRDPGIGIAVNISAGLLADAGFVRALQGRLEALGPLAANLTFELTETAAVEQTEHASRVLHDLRARGVRISIDDYGTGRATMGYLRDFPADEVKIDKSFVTHMLDDVSDQIFVRSAVELARELNFAVVAEGAEDERCVEKLGEYGCDYVQGWAVGKPMSAADFEARFVSDVQVSRVA